MSKFLFIKPSNGLWKSAKIEKTKNKILEAITDMPAIVRAQKHNMELLTMIANMVEHKIDNQGKKEKLKIDKKALVVEIYTSLYGALTPQDVQTLMDNIEYLHSNDKIIKYPLWKVIIGSVVEWCKKK
jgi:hypothetical protein